MLIDMGSLVIEMSCRLTEDSVASRQVSGGQLDLIRPY